MCSPYKRCNTPSSANNPLSRVLIIKKSGSHWGAGLFTSTGTNPVSGEQITLQQALLQWPELRQQQVQLLRSGRSLP